MSKCAKCGQKKGGYRNTYCKCWEVNMSFNNMAAAQRAYDRQEPNFELACEEIPEMDAEQIEIFFRWMIEEDKQVMLEKICETLANPKSKIFKFEEVFASEILEFMKR